MKQGDLVRHKTGDVGLVIDPDYLVEAMPTVRLCEIRLIGGSMNGETISLLRHDLKVIK